MCLSEEAPLPVQVHSIIIIMVTVPGVVKSSCDDVLSFYGTFLSLLPLGSVGAV